MGKSTPKVPDTQTVKQETIPDWLKPSVLDVVGRARSVADQPYTPYPYERIAGFTPAQQQVQQNMLGMQAPNQFAFGSGLAAAAGQGSLQAGDYRPSQFTAQQIGMPNLQSFQMGPAMQVNPYQSPQPQSGGPVIQRGADGRSTVTLDKGRGLDPRHSAANAAALYAQNPDPNAVTLPGQRTSGVVPPPGGPGVPGQQTAGRMAPRNFPPQMGGVTPQPSGPGAIAPQMAAAQTQFQPTLNAFQMGPVREVSSQMVGAPEMQGAQTGFGQQPLEQFRMAGPEMFGQQQAQQYMSPYMQNVMDVQKREAVRDAQRGQLVQDLGAARQGTYGGSRQLLAGLERERQLGQRLGDIQATGQQAAYESAQAQFERDRAAGMTAGQANLQAALQQQQLGTQTGLQAALANLSNEQQARVNNQALQFQAQGMNQDQAMRAALANQGVDVTRAQADQQAALQTQQLGTQTGLQTALANLDAASQANVQNLAAQLQTQGLNADQALRAALANQQAGLTVGQQNLQALLQTQQLGAQTGLEALRANQQAALEAQRLGEQSRQFGSSQGLAGLAQAGQMAQTLGNLGQYQQQADIQRLNMMQQAAGLPQALEQQRLDQFYADFLRQRDYPQETLGFYSNVIRGLPAGSQTTSLTYGAPPSISSQVLGTGLGALGAARYLGAG